VVILSSRRRVRDKWRAKKWYTIVSPSYFGGIELGTAPSDEPDKLLGRVIEVSLYDITEDFSHQYVKMFFQVISVEGKKAETIFKGHEYSRDYLRSLVRRRTTLIERVVSVSTKKGYKLRLTICAFTLTRKNTSQGRLIRDIMKRIVEKKSDELTFDQFVQETVLGKIASDIYNEAKKVAPLRHMGIRKSKLVLQPTTAT
jgi:small subunit ribosomal protein S3Ae